MRIYIEVEGGVATVVGHAPNLVEPGKISVVIVDRDVEVVDEYDSKELTQEEVAQLLFE